MDKLKSERIKVLNEIHKLLPKCECLTDEEMQGCSNCKDLAKLGEQLLNLVRPRRRVLGSDEVPKTMQREKIQLTVKEYLYHTFRGKTVKHIASMKFVSTTRVQEWIDENAGEIERERRKLMQKAFDSK